MFKPLSLPYAEKIKGTIRRMKLYENITDLIWDYQIFKSMARHYQRHFRCHREVAEEYGNPKPQGANLDGRRQGANRCFDSRKQLIKKLREIGITICERNISYARKFAFTQS